MKNVLFLIGALSMFGCAVGSSDPTGDETLGTPQAGGPAGPSTSQDSPPSGRASAADNTVGAFGHTSALDPSPQVIPDRPGHGPQSPGPGPMHAGPGLPR